MRQQILRNGIFPKSVAATAGGEGDGEGRKWSGDGPMRGGREGGPENEAAFSGKGVALPTSISITIRQALCGGVNGFWALGIKYRFYLV